MINVWLHLGTLAVAALVTITLCRGFWTDRAPHLAVFVWQAATLGAIAATVGVLLSAGLAPYGGSVVPALATLASDVALGTADPQLAARHLVLVATGLVIAGLALAAQVDNWRRSRRHRTRQRQLLRLVARRQRDGQALVVEHPAVAAYYLPGHSGCVVISSGALTALTADELAAVLAHEHAHARERHHVALAPFYAVHRALPCRATAHLAARLELLIEMCADDHAAHRHGTAALVGALRRFRELGTRRAPPGALAAADHAIDARIQRLLRVQQPPSVLLKTAAVTVALILIASPVSLFVLP